MTRIDELIADCGGLTPSHLKRASLVALLLASDEATGELYEAITDEMADRSAVRMDGMADYSLRAEAME